MNHIFFLFFNYSGNHGKVYFYCQFQQLQLSEYTADFRGLLSNDHVMLYTPMNYYCCVVVAVVVGNGPTKMRRARYSNVNEILTSETAFSTGWMTNIWSK